MKRPSDSPDTYVKSVTEPVLREMLETIRELIRTEFPTVMEGIKHGMLDYPGLANLGAQKHYVALYVSADVLAEHRDLVGGIDCGKSCIRFKRPEQIEHDDLRRLLRYVARHNA